MKTLKLRIRDKHCKELRQMACDVNLVWNYVNELCYKHLKKTGKFFNAFDIHSYTKGASEFLKLNSKTIDAIREEYCTRRRQSKKAKLRWRVSNPLSSRRSLGWVPFKKACIKARKGFVCYRGIEFQLWDSYDLSLYKDIRCGSFVEDARGRWYVCLVVKDFPKQKSEGTESVGIDLGLKDLAVCSDGTKISNPKYFKRYQQKLGIAQRARKKKQVRAIHARIANCRRDHLQKESTKLIKKNAFIVIGNLDAQKLTKTRMAKSVLDTGFAAFKDMLRYKCEYAGVMFMEVNEAWSTQTCSCCGQIGFNSPKGRAGLGIRKWTCSVCGSEHDRDVNAAKNIFRLGHQTLAEGATL